jgi:V/A-type H+-transporting ATPase subunit I
MLFTEPMKKIELLILKDDLDAVMRYLGFSGCVQLIAEGREQRELSAEEREIADLRLKVESVARFLGVQGGTDDAARAPAPERALLRARAQALIESTRELLEEEGRLLQRKLALEKTADELSVFSHITIPFSSLRNTSHLVFRAASVAPDSLEEFEKRLGKRTLIIRLNRPGHFLAVAPKKGRWALDSELRKLEAQEIKIPEGMKGVPADMLAAVNADLGTIAEGLREVESRKTTRREESLQDIRFLLDHLELDTTIDTVKQNLLSTGSVQKIAGWIPRRQCDQVVKGLDTLTRGRLALKAFDPEEVPEVAKGATKVPVSTPHGRLTRSFERMVLSYSVPLYGTIDPTPFVAVMFILLFAIMFGDVGQGFVGLALGLLINSGKIKFFAPYKKKNFGTVFILAGAASMVAGFLYGSFFANEEVLVPVSHALSQLVLKRPLDHIISLVGFQKIILFFGVTVGVGAVINSVGLIINVVNTLRRGDWQNGILAKTGLAGAVFFWYVLFIAVRILLGGHLVLPDMIVIAVPLLALFFRELIIHLVTGHRPLLKDGLFAFIMEGIVEILESTIYYVSNSVSFLRVAAFALAHTVLSTIVFLLAGMVGGAPGGIVFRIIVILIGNGIIIVLEGLIVTIQVVRLQYYEFFSKFFTESGEEFTPFILRTSGGLR